MNPIKENNIPWHYVQISNDGYNDVKSETKNMKTAGKLQKETPDFPKNLNTPFYSNALQEQNELQKKRKTSERNSRNPSPRMYTIPNNNREFTFDHPVKVQLGGHTASLNVGPHHAHEKHLYTCDATVNSPFLCDNTLYNRRNPVNGLANEHVSCNTTSSGIRDASANPSVYSSVDQIRMHPPNHYPDKICSKHRKHLESIANAEIEKNTPFLYRSGFQKKYFSNYSHDMIFNLKNKKQSLLDWIAPGKPLEIESMPPCPTSRLCSPYNDANVIQKTARIQHDLCQSQNQNLFFCNNHTRNTDSYGCQFIREPEQCGIPCSFNSNHSTHIFHSPKLRVSTAGPFVEKQLDESPSGTCAHQNCVLSKMFNANPLSKANECAFAIGERFSHLFGQKNVSPPYLYPPRPLQRLFPNLFKIAASTTISTQKKKKGFFRFLNKKEDNTPPHLHAGLLGALEDVSIMGAVLGNFFLDAMLVTMDILTFDDRLKYTIDKPMCQCELPRPRYPQGGHYSNAQDTQTRATGCWLYDAVNNFMDAATVTAEKNTGEYLQQIPAPETQMTGIKIVDRLNTFLDNLCPQPKKESKKVYQKDPYNALRRCFERNSALLAKPWKMSDLLLPFVPCQKLYNPDYAHSWLSKLCSGQTDSLIPRCPQHIKYTNFDLIPPEENEDDVQHLTYPLYHTQQIPQSPSISPALVYNENY